MANASIVRDRIIRILMSRHGFVSRTKLINCIGSSYRAQADDQISQMLSEGILVQTGLGKRGVPFMIGLNQTYPGHICPLCGQKVEFGHPLFRKS